MNSGLFKIISDSEYRDQLFGDPDFWLIMFGLSYFLLLCLNRELFVKQKSFKYLLFVAVGLAVFANTMHFLVLNTPSVIMSLNGPLICVILYRLSYELYVKIFDRPPLAPIDLVYNFNSGLTEDRVFNILVLMAIVFSWGLLVTIK